MPVETERDDGEDELSGAEAQSEQIGYVHAVGLIFKLGITICSDKSSWSLSCLVVSTHG